ncbi:hypothetical protein [Salimicrobium humidisoli]|uniref:Uncharacterized protein n=1 Tax=Salimicrobium humidisoli TaxID=2029857 RepID=A0ABX4HUA7_9BACI|nr:hypothetical protein [Salimicrobium humidisoli]PBB06280.1 hypothetical protein CKW00_04420 [Salimicrobium humidisoli]
MKLKILTGILMGFTIGFLLVSFWKNDIDWSLWGGLMIGGIVAHFIMINVNERKKNKRLY